MGEVRFPSSQIAMSDPTVSPLPNPDTPLAFLDPTAAYQTSVSLYITVAALGILVWDILDNLFNEFDILFKSRISLSTVAYIGSRVGTMGYVISSAIFETAPTGHCAAFEKITDAWYPVSLGFSALLFFLRVKAIYNRNPLVVAFFFVLWLGLLACTLFIPIGATGGDIASTKYCEDVNVPNTAYAAVTAPLVHDTLVFAAISWRLVQNAHAQGFKEGWRVALLGQYLPTFTRGLLLDGQKYYLVTLVSSLITVIFAFDQSVPVPMRTMFATLNIVLVNIMACRVYRRTKSGLLRESEISTTHMASDGNSKGRPAVISVQTNRVRTTDDSYRVDIELANRKKNSMAMVSKGIHSKTMVATVDGASDIDIEAKAADTEAKNYSMPSLGRTDTTD